MIVRHPVGLLRVPPLISPYRHTPCTIVEPAPGFDPKFWTGRSVLLRHFHIDELPTVQLEFEL